MLKERKTPTTHSKNSLNALVSLDHILRNPFKQQKCLPNVEIDNQDYSQFINDQSDFVINQNGEIQVEDEETKDKELENVDVNNLVTLIRAEDKKQEAQEPKDELGENDKRKAEVEPDKLQEQEEEQAQPNEVMGNLKDTRKGNKKTKETMKIEPMPLFDCMYCVKDSKLVFQRISEASLRTKYEKIMRKHHQVPNHRISDQMTDQCIEQLLYQGEPMTMRAIH